MKTKNELKELKDAYIAARDALDARNSALDAYIAARDALDARDAAWDAAWEVYIDASDAFKKADNAIYNYITDCAED